MNITVEQGLYVLRPKPHEVTNCRLIRGAREDRTGSFIAPFTKETRAALVTLGYQVPAAEPTRVAYYIDALKGNLVVRTPASAVDIAACRGIPDRKTWRPEMSAWLCRPTVMTLQYLRETWPDATWSDAAQELVGRLDATIEEQARAVKDKASILANDNPVYDYTFHSTPYKHQEKAFLLGRHKQSFAYLMEQGTGKTKVTLDDLAYNYQRGRITGALVVCLNSAKSNWADEEISAHLPPFVPRKVLIWASGLTKRQEELLQAELAHPTCLTFLIMNVEAFSHERATLFAASVLKRGKWAAVIDECQKMKTPSAKRTRNLVALGPLAVQRRLLSGTPITKGPLDIYAPFRFLDPDILGFSSFTAFKNHHAVLGGYLGRDIVGFKHVEDITAKIDPYSFRVLKDDCLDLPAKVYQKLEVDLAPEQRGIYDQMRDQMLVKFADGQAAAPIVLTQMLRLQQITGGFLPVDLPVDDFGEHATELRAIPGPNPKVDALTDLIDQVVGKVIIFCRFRSEIDVIATRLKTFYGMDSVVEFHGGVNEDNRTIARRRFQDLNDPCRFFVAQGSTGGVSLTLHAASTVVYLSNSFSLEDRLQSEDRAHRIGQTKHVTYVDVVAKNTLDEKIRQALRDKKGLADQVTGDAWKAWI